MCWSSCIYLVKLITFNNKIQLSINLSNDKTQNDKTQNDKIQNNNDYKSDYKSDYKNDYKSGNYEYNTQIDTDKVDSALKLLETITIDNLFEIIDEPKNSIMELIDDLEI